MKWKISQKEFNRLSPKDQKSGFFDVKKQGHTGALRKKKPWAYYDNLPIMGRQVKRKYEIFCGGFLYFYDHRLRRYLASVNLKVNRAGDKFLEYFKGKSFNHDLSFVWKDDKKHKGRMAVTIYLDPPAGNPDPPTTPAPPPPETST
jgi:hypothetical protein